MFLWEPDLFIPLDRTNKEGWLPFRESGTGWRSLVNDSGSTESHQ